MKIFYSTDFCYLISIFNAENYKLMEEHIIIITKKKEISTKTQFVTDHVLLGSFVALISLMCSVL